MNCKLCRARGRTAKVFAKGLCAMHHSRQRRGRPMEPPRWASRLTKRQIDTIMNSDESASSLAKRLPVGADYIRKMRRGERVPTPGGIYATRNESRALLPEGESEGSEQGQSGKDLSGVNGPGAGDRKAPKG